ncbi:MAG TPA: GAF domain-containing protein [Chloroflexi bacterium]|nr:GAF domain-containing protein [Chloroflexota bacterium]
MSASQHSGQWRSALSDIVAGMAALPQPEIFLGEVLDTVLSALSADAGWVVLFGSSPEVPPIVPAWRGLPKEFVGVERLLPTRGCLAHTTFAHIHDRYVASCHFEQCPRISPVLPTSFPFKFHTSVALRTGEELLGTLNIAWRSDLDLSPQDHLFLKTLGQQMGIYLRMVRLSRKVDQLDRLRLIARFADVLVSSLEIGEIVEKTTHYIQREIGFPLVGMAVLPGSSETSLRVYSPDTGWFSIPLFAVWGPSQFEDLRNTPEGIIVSRKEFPPLLAQYLDVGLLDRWGDEGILLPITDQEEKLTAVLACGGKRPLTEEDCVLLRAMVTYIGHMLRNAALHRALQDHAAQMSIISAANLAATSSLDLDTVLQRSLRAICTALDAYGGTISLYDHKSGAMVPRMKIRDGEIVPFLPSSEEETPVETPILTVPLVYQGETIGVIDVFESRRGEFSREEQAILQAVAPVIAMALQNARLHSDLRSRVEELAVLNEVGMSLTRTLVPTALIRTALEQIFHLFYADRVFLLERGVGERDICRAYLVDQQGIQEFYLRIVPGRGVSGWVVERRTPLVIADLLQDPRWSRRRDRHLGDGARSVMAVPLVVENRLLGLIEVVKDVPKFYTAGDLRLLQTFASMGAVALENARLYDEQQRLIQERERALAQVTQASKMVALGRLAASVAHEINNPLQAVQGALTLLREELAGLRRMEKLDRYLTVAQSETNRIAGIVRRLREFYRPAPQEMRTTELHGLLEQVLELVENHLQKRRILVKKEWSDDLPYIQANPDHLKQVFLNLFINAIEAMPEGGTLTIRTARDRQGIMRGGQKVPAIRVDVCDTGVGIPKEMLPYLFEPFVTTKEGGSGLGLFVSYGIVEVHGGTIEVASREGNGTMVTVRLPVNSPEEYGLGGGSVHIADGGREDAGVDLSGG